MPWSLLIRNGTVIDGSGAPGFAADVGVEGDHIAAMGPSLSGRADRVVDADGLIVAPGFIDMHAHSDLVYHECPSAESKVRQGVTTEVVGMCSFSPAPVAPGGEDELRRWAAGLGANLRIRWRTFGEYLHQLRGLGVSLNIVHFVGHGALRLAAIGPEDRHPSITEMEHMKHDLSEALDAGAFGMSTGLVYAPSEYATTPELIELARSMTDRNGIYSSHVRGEGATLIEAIAEAIQIGAEAGVPVQISHVKASGRENWGKIDRVLSMIDEARSRGLDVTGDVYPYAAGSTKLDNLLPAWMHDGGIEKLHERLKDPAARQRAVSECLTNAVGWRSCSGTVGWEDVQIATCPQRDLEGLNLTELARRNGRPPAEAMMDLILSERAAVSMVVFSQSEENVRKVLAHPQVMVGSDTLCLTCGPGPHSGKPHPRTYGTFPRVLGHFCRDEKLLSLEAAVHKMTGQTAAKLGLKDRGLLRQGYAADFAIFDPANVKDEATYTDPHQHPTGLPFVIVNGRLVVDDGRMKASPAGRVLRPSR